MGGISSDWDQLATAPAFLISKPCCTEVVIKHWNKEVSQSKSVAKIMHVCQCIPCTQKGTLMGQPN